MVGAKVWRRAQPLPEDERADYAEAAAVLETEPSSPEAPQTNGSACDGPGPIPLPMHQAPENGR